MPGKIKICYILSCLSQGGAERQTINLVSQLDQLKYDITFLLYDSESIFYKEIYSLPVHIIERTAKKENKISKYIKLALFLRSYLSKNDFDIIHTMLFYNGFWVRLVAPKKYKDKIIFALRGSLDGLNRYFFPFEKLFIKKSYVITNSLKGTNQYLQLVSNKYLNKITTIYNGIQVKKFSNPNIPELQSTLVIGTVGRQTKGKNQIQILKVLDNIKNDISFKFYLIGSKTYDESVTIQQFIIDKHLDDNVVNLDSQSNIEEYYKKFNIFILSSKYEGCPNVLLEAMLSRCLCIISEGANSDQFVIDGVNGFVYDGTNEMLESKLLFAINLLRNGQADAIINNGFDYVNTNFSMSKMVASYERIYEHIALSKY